MSKDIVKDTAKDNIADEISPTLRGMIKNLYNLESPEIVPNKKRLSVDIEEFILDEKLIDDMIKTYNLNEDKKHINKIIHNIITLKK